jgi:hypothetical protein
MVIKMSDKANIYKSRLRKSNLKTVFINYFLELRHT